MDETFTQIRLITEHDVIELTRFEGKIRLPCS
jgi:hypothetical protein